jgi:predicted phage-related endonuclease
MNSFSYMEDREFSNGRNYIGASDMATLARINPYKTPMELWEELTGRAEGFKGNVRSEWGHNQEPLILGEYVRRIYGDGDRNDFITSRMWGETQYKDLHSWTEASAGDRKVAHADLLDLSGEVPILVQAKNSGAYAAATRKRDRNRGYDREDLSANGIPLSVYFQEQWEMFNYGVQTAYAAVLIDGWDWKLYGPVNYEKKIVENLLALSERMLWHVDKDVPPTPKTWGDVVKLNPDFKPATKTVVADEQELECRAMLQEYAGLTDKMKDLERRKDDITNALGLYIGGNQYLNAANGDGLASASEIAGRETISISELKKNPDLFKAVQDAGLINVGETRRQLYVKGVATGTIDRWTLLTTDDGEKWKRSRKKYTSAEKKEAAALLKSLKIESKWEKTT